MNVRFSGPLPGLMADVNRQASQMGTQISWSSPSYVANDTKRRLGEIHRVIDAQNKLLEAVVQRLDKTV